MLFLRKSPFSGALRRSDFFNMTPFSVFFVNCCVQFRKGIMVHGKRHSTWEHCHVLFKLAESRLWEWEGPSCPRPWHVIPSISPNVLHILFPGTSWAANSVGGKKQNWQSSPQVLSLGTAGRWLTSKDVTAAYLLYRSIWSGKAKTAAQLWEAHSWRQISTVRSSWLPQFAQYFCWVFGGPQSDCSLS